MIRDRARATYGRLRLVAILGARRCVACEIGAALFVAGRHFTILACRPPWRFG
jgi:hypothetical protein